MNKKALEICASSGLVLLMILLLILVQTEAPEPMRSAGFVIAVLAFMILMGLAGFGLLRVEP